MWLSSLRGDGPSKTLIALANILHCFQSIKTLGVIAISSLAVSQAENIVFLLLCSFITNNTQFNNFQKIKHQKVSQINFTSSKGFQ